MPCSRLIRALAALSLAASLLLIPAAVNAAPRTDHGDDDGSPLMVRVWDWLSSIWGGGGGGFDPSGANRNSQPVPEPEPEPTPEPTPAPAIAPAPHGPADVSSPRPFADVQR